MTGHIFDFIGWLLVGSMLITGVWNAFLPDQIFGKLGSWMWHNLPHNLCKPLFGCPMCMASAWGTALFIGYGGDSLKLWFVYIVSLSGLMKWLTILILNKDQEDEPEQAND